MNRKDFNENVGKRDNNQCVVCKAPHTAVHHIVERCLWEDGGFYADNGVCLCDLHHLQAEQTLISCKELRDLASIKTILLPNHLDTNVTYDKWANPYINKNVRVRGELFFNENVQKILTSANVLSDFIERAKYPKTLHLPWSEGLQSDDRMLQSFSGLEGEEVIVALKLDGENSSLAKTYMHARSLDSANHPSRNWLKALHGTIKHELPENFIICGENCYAEHSIHYSNLPSYFFVFNIWEKSRRLSWDSMVEYCDILNLQTVPVLWRGIWNEAKIREITQSLDPARQEGVVIQVARSVAASEWKKCSAKFVRKGHVQTDDKLWMLKPVVANGLAPSLSEVSFDGEPKS